MKVNKPIAGILFALAVICVIFVGFTTTTLPNGKKIPLLDEHYKNEDDVVPLEQLYADRTNSPENTPSLHANSTADLLPPVTTIDLVKDNDMIPLNITNGTYTITGDYFTVEFHANDTSGIQRFECNINSMEFKECLSPILVYTKPESNGTKAIEIRAVDTKDNVERQPSVIVYETK